MSDAASPNQTIDSMHVLQSLPDALFVVDPQSRVLAWNNMAEQLSGYGANELIGHPCPEGLLQNVGQCAPDACHGACSAHVCLNDGKRREMVTYIRHRDGHLVPVLLKLSPLMQEQSVVATVAQFSDMTPRAVQEPRLNSTVESGEWVDTVTLLPSVLASTAQLRESFERWKLTGERFSVVLISVLDAHILEKRHGAKIKERLFAALGKTLSGAVRQNDYVGRWMEEQFIALLPHCALPQARDAGGRLLALVQQTAVCHDGEYVKAQVEFAVTSVRANDTPQKLLERVNQELRRKEQVAQPTSPRLTLAFHQQRPM
jgi:PAS domain S-box-containing protein/diguanylate cyclase (GGDEF)-like protein